MDLIKRSAKRFLLNEKNNVDFAAPNPLTKQASNTSNSTNKLCSEFAPRNPDYSSITDSDNSINKLTTNNSNSNIQIETANSPHSLFALNCLFADQFLSQLNNFQRIAKKFKTGYMMSHSNSDEETLMHVCVLSKDATKRKNEGPNKESRVIPHPEVGLSVPRTEASLEIRLAKKRPGTKRSKKSLDGLYEVLAPSSLVVKTDVLHQ